MKKYPILEALNDALKKSNINMDKVCLVSDVFYTPEAIKPLEVDFINTHRGRSVAFGTGLKLGNPDLQVISLVGDLATLGGNHLVHAGRRNMNLIAICINNFVYPTKSGEQSPAYMFSTYSNFERPFNIPHIAKSCGAVFVARWTALHTKQLTDSLLKAMTKEGLSVIEVIAPGGHYFAGVDALENESELINFCYKNSEVKNGEDTQNLEIKTGKKIIVGEFIERKRLTFLDSYNARLSEVMGNKFVPYGGKIDRD